MRPMSLTTNSPFYFCVQSQRRKPKKEEEEAASGGEMRVAVPQFGAETKCTDEASAPWSIAEDSLKRMHYLSPLPPLTVKLHSSEKWCLYLNGCPVCVWCVLFEAQHKKKKKEKKTLKVDFLKLDTNTGYNLIQHLEMFLWPVMFLFCCKSKKNKIFNGVITI